MVKEKRILSYFIVWLIIGFCILFVGVNNVFAEEITPTEIRSQIRTIYTDGTTQWYKSDNNTYTTPLYFGTGPSYSTYGIPCNFRLLVVSNIENTYSYKYSYDMHIFTPYSTSNTWDSSKIDSQYDLNVVDDAGIVKESRCSVVSTEKNTNVLGTFMNKSISCVFSVNKNYTNAYISAGYSCKGNCELSNMEPLGFIPQDSYMSIDNVRIEKLSDNSNVIIDQNQTIIDQNNTTNEKLDDIIQNENENTDKIIDNQNSNTDKEIESQKICDFIDKSNIKENGKFLNASGVLTNYADSGVTDYININGAEVITLTNVSSVNGVHLCYYTVNKELISCVNSATTINEPLNLPQNAYYMRATILTIYNRPTYQICKNGNQGLNDKLDGLQGAITDSSSPNTGALENSAGWLPAGPLDSILNLPLTMLNSLTNSLGKTCTPLNLTLPYVNKNIQIPCLSAIFAQITGVNGLWTWVGTIASVLILYNYLLNLYAWVDRVLTLRAEFDEAMGADLANWGRL